MTTENSDAGKVRVGNAAKRLYEADQAIQQPGGITQESLQELDHAYQEYVKARVSHQPDVLDRILDFIQDP